MIKISRFGNDCLTTHIFESYEDLKVWVEKEIQQFKIKNHVINEDKDRYFIDFKNEMEVILSKFKHHENESDYLKCNKCVDSDHEDIFCRCESRNIRIAKERREKGEGSWKNKKSCD